VLVHGRSNACIFFQKWSQDAHLCYKTIVLGGSFFFDLAPLWDYGGGGVVVGDLVVLGGVGILDCFLEALVPLFL
jgi:hypothetical protein